MGTYPTLVIDHFFVALPVLQFAVQPITTLGCKHADACAGNYITQPVAIVHDPQCSSTRSHGISRHAIPARSPTIFLVHHLGTNKSRSSMPRGKRIISGTIRTQLMCTVFESSNHLC